MNIQLDLKIPFINATGNLIVSADLLLSPFYVSEKELLSTYLTTYTNDQFLAAREIIFSSSITADELINNNLDKLPEKELALFRRNLTLCLAIVAFGNKFNADYIKSLSRSKSLAEFSVSTTTTNDPQFVVNIIKDAKQCVEDAKELIDAIALNGEGLIKTFIKSELNPHSNEVNRLWHHYVLPIKSREAYASEKTYFNGRFYKNGGNFN